MFINISRCIALFFILLLRSKTKEKQLESVRYWPYGLTVWWVTCALRLATDAICIGTCVDSCVNSRVNSCVSGSQMRHTVNERISAAVQLAPDTQVQVWNKCRGANSVIYGSWLVKANKTTSSPYLRLFSAVRRFRSPALVILFCGSTNSRGKIGTARSLPGTNLHGLASKYELRRPDVIPCKLNQEEQTDWSAT